MDQFVREFSDVVHSWTLEEFRTQVGGPSVLL